MRSQPHALPKRTPAALHGRVSESEIPAQAPTSAADPEAVQAGQPSEGTTNGEGPQRKRRRRRRRRGAAAGAGDASGVAEQPQQQAPRPHDARPRGAGRPRPHRGHGEHQALAAVRALSAMAESLLQVEGVDLLSRPRFLDLNLRIPLDVKRDGIRASARVVEQILARVHEVRAHERALVPGAVYCFFHERADVDSARPADPRQVFEGYSSTGRPQFTDFVTRMIESKAPGIDEMLAGEESVVAAVTMGRVLRTAQLAEFGKASPVFRILGQVDAGLFPTLSGSAKAAFSFQLLLGTTIEGKPRLKIHAVGAVDLTDLADPEVAFLLSRFQHRIDEAALQLAGKQASGAEVDSEEFVLPLLQDLARQLMASARRRNRRTRHANERTEEGQRPTTKAWADASEAGDGDLLWDEVEGTIVVLGPRGRVHVFTPSGKHVTSVVMNGASIEKRRQQGRWRAAEPAERGEFRIRLRRVDVDAEQAAAVAEAERRPAPGPARPAATASPAAPVAAAEASAAVEPGGAEPVQETSGSPQDESPQAEPPQTEPPQSGPNDAPALSDPSGQQQRDRQDVDQGT